MEEKNNDERAAAALPTSSPPTTEEEDPVAASTQGDDDCPAREPPAEPEPTEPSTCELADIAEANAATVDGSAVTSPPSVKSERPDRRETIGDCPSIPASSVDLSQSASADTCYLGDIMSPSHSDRSSVVASPKSKSFDNRDVASPSSTATDSVSTPTSTSRPRDTMNDDAVRAVDIDPRPPRRTFTKSKSCVDGVQLMYEPVLTFPPHDEHTADGSVCRISKSWNHDTFSSTFPLDDEAWSTAGEAADSNVSAASQVDLAMGGSGSKRGSPDKSILDSCFLDEDEHSVKSATDTQGADAKGETKPYSHVSEAHEILNSFLALNPSPERVDRTDVSLTNFGTPSNSSCAQIEERVDRDTLKPSLSNGATSTSPRDPNVSMTNIKRTDNKTPLRSNSLPSNNEFSPKMSNDKKKLNERLRQRLAERNQRIRLSNSGEKSSSEKEGGRMANQARLLKRTHKRPVSCSTDLGSFPRFLDPNHSDAASDILLSYGIRSSLGVFPDTVTFDSEDGDSQPNMNRRSFRKSTSEAGISLGSGSTTVRTAIHRQIPPPHGIGILQADGVIFDDALLLRLARQARYSRLRGEMPNAAVDAAMMMNGERRFNLVKIHVYDLLQRDALVEMPYFNCNFPIGQCFQVMNNAANCLGTGAYHVGVEVNGIEYAFGANNIIGMSGVFTCTPKQSPGYEYRETLDFGNIYTTRKTWIRIPKENVLGRTICKAFGGSRDTVDGEELNMMNTSTVSTAEYTFRQIETFADGNAVIHSMAREYMGSDYDLLRKNCCTFARDVCLRLGVKEEDIPTWFHNAAKAGADAEDAITSAEQTVKNMFDCADMDGDPIDFLEGYNHGFEVIADLKKGSSKLKVVESLPVYRHASARQPLLDCEDQSEFWETLSWTY
ncbi:hypothetical protein HJC23_002724 [Cyclotella cryptica]|uniref:PPPDE domain-containing protein n=1 Tax=Cyclotella cryptica TaxID=29204 RepID=A0ABD3PBV5_9STRA|eukprot:CCRYP_016042-RA/>CCRYP_016042-RA protein AED:0.25 eAED:-0.36 QI:0/0/0/1/1/1/2/0/891